MKEIVEKIINYEYLTEDDAKRFIFKIDAEEFNEANLGAILTGIQIRGATLEELNGFRSALLEVCIPIQLDAEKAIDVCGTGGDGKDTFNISTTTAFVLSAMGIKVIKHGNYGVSSVCGSSNVLESVGIKFKSDSNELSEDLKSKNICFIHAPLFHPTLKKVANVRRNLGIRTVFNSLGPLVNPAQPKFQLTGTYSLELAHIYTHLLKDKRTDFRVIYGLDGHDEITLTDSCKIIGKYGNSILNSDDLNTTKVDHLEISSGSSITESSRIMINILKGKGTTAQNKVVAANVTTALQMYHPSTNMLEIFREVQAFLQSGQAFKHHKFNL